ncbi:unnamed protein product [Aureobasidium vineae]|uniref:Uncharacterized protein n=1 Tax=Aureobasidium vineae TaxID=2773715 RepID=A0A9N8JLH6_9PEZI|nr:unnamed protein product [Aureobasidium vineae]
MNVLDIVPIGPKEPLPSDLINITDFEWKLVWQDYLPNLASFALGAYERPVADYLDAETLKNSYQAAYRLLLARKLADVLSTDLDRNKTVLATRRYQTQTVVMVPTFVYVVEVKYQLPINASGIPHSFSSSTYDHFYVAMSNLTAGTPLPAWTDERFFYVPFQDVDSRNASANLYRVRTPAVSASLHCYSMYQKSLGKNLTWDIPAGSPSCNLSSLQTYKSVESRSPEAIEYMSFDNSYSSNNHTSGCELTVLAGWGRSSKRSIEQPLDASWIGCQPQLHVELREVMVDHKGLVQSSTPINDTMDHENRYLQAGSSDILDAFHTLLTLSIAPKYPYVSSKPYHNDSYPSDFVNYLLAQTLNSSATLDPHLPPPSFNTTAPIVEALYARIFAIVLGTRINTILQPSNKTIVVAGSVLSPEIHLEETRVTELKG